MHERRQPRAERRRWRRLWGQCDELGIMVYHDMQYAQQGHAPANTTCCCFPPLLFSGGADGDNREDFSRSPLAQRGRSG